MRLKLGRHIFYLEFHVFIDVLGGGNLSVVRVSLCGEVVDFDEELVLLDEDLFVFFVESDQVVLLLLNLVLAGFCLGL